MGLGFLVPAFLLGLVVLAVPVIAHLRQREQREPIRFPSLMFLGRVTQRTVQRRRIVQPLLLVLRALAVAALVLAFARPFLQRDPERSLQGRQRALVVLLDRSMSMAYAGVWAEALDSVRSAVGRLGPGDRAALVAFDEAAEVIRPLTDDLASIVGALGAVEPGSAGTRLASAFRSARDVAASSDGLALEVLLVSDLQRHALQGLETVDPIPGANLRVAPVGPADVANARVVSVSVDRVPVGRLTELRVGARVASQGPEDGRSVQATLAVNGRDLATTEVVLPARGLTSLTFPAVRIPDASARASVRLAADDLTPDDEHRFAVDGPAALHVVLLVPPGLDAGELVYLERALAISRAPTFVVDLRRGPLRRQDLERAVAVVAADLAPLAQGDAALTAFLQRGGGLVAFAGPRIGGAEIRWPWLPAAVGRVVDRSRDRGGSLGWLQAEHPVFEPFREAVSSDFGAARYFRYRELTTDSAAVTLARFDDGRPALVERQVGGGRVLLVGSSADGLWNDLPLQPVFLPLVHRLVAYAARLGDDRRAWEVGDVASLPSGSGELVVREPGGDVRRFPPDSAPRTLKVERAGYYDVETAGGVAGPTLAVNPPAIESDLARAGPAEVVAALRVTGDSTSAGEPVPLTAGQQEGRQSWWAWLLGVALMLLAGEAWYAARLSGRVSMKGGMP